MVSILHIKFRVIRLVSPAKIHQKLDRLLQVEEHTFTFLNTPWWGLQHDVGHYSTPVGIVFCHIDPLFLCYFVNVSCLQKMNFACCRPLDNWILLVRASILSKGFLEKD